MASSHGPKCVRLFVGGVLGCADGAGLGIADGEGLVFGLGIIDGGCDGMGVVGRRLGLR